MKKRGFTLLELIIVIIIIGILATLAFTQYAKLVEKGRTAEAKMILGQLRTAQEAYYLENNSYTATEADLAVDVPTTTCVTTHYFTYDCTSTSSTTFDCTATRCISGGKTPDFTGTTAYTITLDETGTWGGSAGYY